MSTKKFDILSNVIPGVLSTGWFFYSLVSLCNGNNGIGFRIVLGVDLYLLWVLVYAGLKSDRYRDDNFWMGILIPSRTLGIFIFLFLYASVVNGFAMMFIEAEPAKYSTINFSVYRSFIGLSSFTYDMYNDDVKQGLWRIQMWQTGNGLLLLTAAFGFLVSRISTFKTKEEGVVELQNKVAGLVSDINKKKGVVNALNKKIREKKKTLEQDSVTKNTDDNDEVV